MITAISSQLFIELFMRGFSKNEVGRSIIKTETLRSPQDFSEILRGLSVHPLTKEGKCFAFLFDEAMKINPNPNLIEEMVFEICFDLEWAWRSPGKGWLERKIINA